VNKHAYAHKQGYFQELGNANNAGSNGCEESLNGDMDNDKPKAGNGEFEGDMEDDKPEAGNGEIEGNSEEDE
jgi:hypothetical protein